MGVCKVIIIDPKFNDSVKKVQYQFHICNIHQVIYGRMNENTDYKLTFIIDAFSLGMKDREEVPDEYYFEDKQVCFELIESIKIINDLMENSMNGEASQSIDMARYNRRAHLFVLEQATTSKLMGSQKRKIKNLFRLKGISPLNKMGLQEIMAQKEINMKLALKIKENLKNPTIQDTQ